MLTSQYITDHLQYIDNLQPEFGKILARLILEKAAEQVSSQTPSDTIIVPLEIVVSEVKLLQCVEVYVNGFRVGHIGI
jgi:hypothetical protein